MSCLGLAGNTYFVLVFLALKMSQLLEFLQRVGRKDEVWWCG